MNVGGLLLFFLYMYSIVGMIAFGAVKRTGLANNQLNFEDFSSSFVTLFVVATGDSWNLIMTTFASEQSSSFECMNSPQYSDYVDNNFVTVGCGQRGQALLFFISYFFLVNLVFLNLFIAIILDGFAGT
jgi:hypothetical protein